MSLESDSNHTIISCRSTEIEDIDEQRPLSNVFSYLGIIPEPNKPAGSMTKFIPEIVSCSPGSIGLRSAEKLSHQHGNENRQIKLAGYGNNNG